MKLREFRESDLEGEWVEGLGAVSIRRDSVRITVVDGDEVVALGGALVGKEVMFWIQVKKHLRHTIGLVRVIKSGIRIIMEKLGVEKATALVRKDFKEGHRTAMFFGFIPTGETAIYDNVIYDWFEIWHSCPYY